MKRIIFSAIISLFALLFANAQEKSAQITFEKMSHDFGSFKEEDGVVSFDFELKNPGDAPLIISRVASSCGCTTPVWPKEPIAPGGKATIKASYDPKGRPGPFNKTITVFSNASQSGTVLTIRGNVTPKPKTPEETYRKRIGDLGLANSHLTLNRVYVSQLKVDTLDVFNFGSEPITISFENIPKHISIDANPQTLKSREAGKIIVTFDSKKQNDWGFVIDRINVLVNKEKLQGNQLSISANIEEDFSNLSAAELSKAPSIEFVEINKDFGTVKEGSTINHDFVFKNNGQSDLIIRKIKASCGCTTVAPKVTVIKPGETSSLSASFKTSGFTGRQSKSITVITNDPKQSTIVLRLSGTVNKE